MTDEEQRELRMQAEEALDRWISDNIKRIVADPRRRFVKVYTADVGFNDPFQKGSGVMELDGDRVKLDDKGLYYSRRTDGLHRYMTRVENDEALSV